MTLRPLIALLPFVFAVSTLAQDIDPASLAKAIQLAEEEELSHIPDLIDCQRVSWMENCKAINKQAKKHPTMPIRLHDKNGHEWNFAPGTPSAMIYHQLEMTPESARALVEYLEKSFSLNKRAASTYKTALYEKGGMTSVNDLDQNALERQKPKDIDFQNIRISTFLKLDDKHALAHLRNLEKFKASYPRLRITVYVPSGTTSEDFSKHITQKGLTGKVVTSGDYQTITSKGVSWSPPTTWVDHTTAKKRRVLVGTKSILQLESESVTLSSINGGGQ